MYSCITMQLYISTIIKITIIETANDANMHHLQSLLLYYVNFT